MDGAEEYDALRKQEDVACLRSKIQTVMEILCSTPLGNALAWFCVTRLSEHIAWFTVEALSYVGEEVREDKRYRLRCTVPLPLASPIDVKTIVQEINKESQRGRGTFGLLL